MNDAFAIAAAKINVEDPLLAKDLDWSMTSPCGDCPFLKSSPFHQGVANSIPAYAESIDLGVFAHTCHKTDNRAACDGPHNWKGDQAKHCAGAIICLFKTGNGKDLQLPLLKAAESGKLDVHKMTAIAEADTRVFTWRQFLEFYAREVGKRARQAKRRLEKRFRRKAC